MTHRQGHLSTGDGGGDAAPLQTSLYKGCGEAPQQDAKKSKAFQILQDSSQLLYHTVAHGSSLSDMRFQLMAEISGIDDISSYDVPSANDDKVEEVEEEEEEDGVGKNQPAMSVGTHDDSRGECRNPTAAPQDQISHGGNTPP